MNASQPLELHQNIRMRNQELLEAKDALHKLVQEGVEVECGIIQVLRDHPALDTMLLGRLRAAVDRLETRILHSDVDATTRQGEKIAYNVLLDVLEDLDHIEEKKQSIINRTMDKLRRIINGS